MRQRRGYDGERLQLGERDRNREREREEEEEKTEEEEEERVVVKYIRQG